MSQPHCTADELLDVAEGTRAAHSLPHLQHCPDCQRQLDDVRMALAEIAEIPVPEPPAAFWNELTQRVHAAVGQEPRPRRPRAWFEVGAWVESLRWRQVWPAAATLAAVLLLAVVLLPHDTGRTAIQGIAPVTNTGSTEQGDVSAEEAAFLSFMGDLAEGLDLDGESANAHGLLPSGATTEAAVADLSGEERVELQRLLQDALRGSGV